MEDIIHFRSKFSRQGSNGSGSRLTFGRSGETTEIRSAFPDDDARDIVWKKSLGNSLFTKNRRGETYIDVTLLVHESPYYNGDKTHTIEKLRDQIQKSCEYSGEKFSYSRFDTTSIPRKKNSLMLVVTSSLDLEDYEKMTQGLFGNDVVFLMLYTPYELEPTGEMLFLSKSPTKRYFQQLNKRIREIEKLVHSSSKSNIVVRTTDNMSLKLNHFFKYRYG